MNEPVPPSGQEDLRETCAVLRHQLNSVLILLFLVSSTLAVSFWRQSSQAGKQRDALQQVVESYQQRTEPVVNDLTAKLREYGKTHPEVMPILIKYGVVQMTSPAAATATPAAR